GETPLHFPRKRVPHLHSPFARAASAEREPAAVRSELDVLLLCPRRWLKIAYLAGGQVHDRDAAVGLDVCQPLAVRAKIHDCAITLAPPDLGALVANDWLWAVEPPHGEAPQSRVPDTQEPTVGAEPQVRFTTGPGPFRRLFPAGNLDVVAHPTD